MGEFDDVLAMQPGDEWDHYDPDAPAPELPELRAELRVPGALVELRGEVPPPLLDRLAPLCDPALHSDEPVPVPLVVAHDGRQWVLEGPDGRVEVGGARAEDLESALLAQLDRIVLGADRTRLHLAAACVELRGAGVLVVDEDPEARAALVTELLRKGARPVTERLLTVMPGSHTVFGYPAPVVGAPGAWAPPPVPFTTVDVVVHAHRSPGASDAIVTPLTTSESCVRLVPVAIDRERFGPAVLDVIAATAADATHLEVVHDDPAAAAAAVAGAEPPPRRSFSVVHRFDEQQAGRPTLEHEVASLRVARFDDGAVALDAASGKVLQLTDPEIEALEDLLVERPSSGRTAPADPRLARLAEHGMYVPDTHGRRPVPGPEAFGLPNCPSGAIAREMWAELTAARRDAESGTARDLPGDGTGALAVLRGAVPGDEEGLRRAAEVHRRVQDEVISVERRLLAVLDLLAGAGVDPIVLGSVVNAHDGPLPPYFAESERIDLLVRDGELAGAVAALRSAGYETFGLPAQGDGERHGAVDLQPPEGPERNGQTVRVRDTLAVGPFGALVDHDEFHRRSVPVRIHGRWCRSLHPEHRFVHACVQLELDQATTTNQLVRDVVLAAPRADVLMAEALEASERWGATATVTAAVRRVDGILPGLPPWIVERSFREDGGRDRRGGRGRWPRRAERTRG